MVNHALPTLMLETGGRRGCQETNSPPLSKRTTPVTRSLNSWVSTQARSNSAVRREGARFARAAAAWSRGLCPAYRPVTTEKRRDQKSSWRASDHPDPPALSLCSSVKATRTILGVSTCGRRPPKEDETTRNDLRVPGAQSPAGTGSNQDTSKHDHGVAPAGPTLPTPTKHRP